MELDDILLYKKESLDEGVIANAGKMLANGVKQVVSNVATGINNITTASNNAVTASNEKTATTQATQASSQMDKMISEKSGISTASQDKQTKNTIALVNKVIKMIDAKIAELQNPAQQAPAQAPTEQSGVATTDVAPTTTVAESINLEDILTNRLYEAVDNKKALENLKKFKDGLSQSISSGVFTSKGLKTITDNIGKIIGDTPEVKDVVSKLTQSYTSSVETQFKDYQTKKTQATPQSQPTQAQQKASVQPAPATTPEQKKQSAVASQDVIKKCSTALGQVSSSIEAIKTKSPTANFGTPKTDGIYATAQGETYIDQVKNLIATLSKDLSGYVLVQESLNQLSSLQRLSEDLNNTKKELDSLID